MVGKPAPDAIGRYLLFEVIASGGMATVHLGRLGGPEGFARTVAIKRLHSSLARDPDFVSMFLDEARLAARVRHPNVVPTLDVVAIDGEVFLVMEYVQGESLARLVRASRAAGSLPPVGHVSAIMSGVLHGLHAAHEAKNDQGQPLHIVHRDVSPQNVMVGVDGAPRVLDFGVAKAVGNAQVTREGQLKGKLSYMAPEQLAGAPVTRQVDVYAASIVLFEALTATRLFQGDNEAAVLAKVYTGHVPRLRELAPHVTPELEEVVMRGLARDPAQRWESARAMALALQSAAPMAAPSDVGDWVEAIARERLAQRAARVAEIESHSSQSVAGFAASPPPTSSVPSRGSRRFVGVIAALAVVAVTTSVAWLLSRPTPVESASAGIAPLAAGLAQIASVAASEVAPTASDAATATPSASSAPSSKPPAARPTAPYANAKPKPAFDCNPPYTDDAKGHRHYKPECL